jgi:V8-like Glu-specific endopeptidase
MSHRLGSLVPITPVREFRPGVGVLVGANTWEDTFSALAPPSGTTKFIILHFSGVSLNASDRLEVPLGNGDTDVFTSAAGPDFWTRPIKGGTVAIRFVDGGSGAGKAPLAAYGRGEGIVNGGQDATAGGNANGDVFLLDTPYVDPPYFNPGGVCPAGARNWENVDCLPTGVMRDVARSTGMLFEIDTDKVSSCSAALIGPDLILTAAHCCASGSAISSGSFTLDFQTDCTGNRPPGYNPTFHKLKRLVKSGWETSPTGAGLVPDSGLDYAIVQIETPAGGLGVPPLPMRADFPPIGEEVFLIHHPRGAPKKISRHTTDPECVVQPNSGTVIRFGGDLDNGSSGSPLFDLAGRIIGVNDWAGGCTPGNGAQSAAAILLDMSTAPPPATDVDVVLVLDRSGSMSLPGLSGGTKIQEAQAAAALFIDLLRTDRTHRTGLVTFSTTADSPIGLALIAANKDALIGPPPARNAGAIAGITPGGMTTIGGGLRTGRQQLTAGFSANTPALLLLTDGLQNTPPRIDAVEAELANTRLCIIGFGSEGQLDGPLLTRLAREHGGIYTRSREGLELKKFFVLCFGNIFQTGISMDPFFLFPAGASSMPPMPLQVCGEETLTVVLSWQSTAESLFLSLVTPAGNALAAPTPGVFSSSGSTWVYFRLPLPFNGERDGTWQVLVTRFAGGGEFPAPLEPERFFVTAVVDGGPYMKPLNPGRRYYTGDVINPQIVLRDSRGFLMDAASIVVDIEMPSDGTGNILTSTGLRTPILVDGDQLDARASTLVQLEQERGGPLAGTVTKTFPLFDDGERDGDGTLEPDGIFGNPLSEILRFEGTYFFHGRASYGIGCIGTRETSWATYVSIGVDPGSTIVTTDPVGMGPDGSVGVQVTLTPRDRYGNYLGPGRLGEFAITGQPGSVLTSGVRDTGDGSYTLDLNWDPDSSTPPGVSIAQPDRAPVGIALPVPEGVETFIYSVKFLCGVQAECACDCNTVRPGTYATEINIHNYLDTEVRVEKHVLPVVFAGAVAGREPHFVGRKAADRIVLPPHTATMDDCCRLTELLLGAAGGAAVPLTTGILEIISNRPLHVSAVYTVSNPQSGAVSMDVEQIQGRHVR